MNIIKQISKSREGNDCWIDEAYIMCEWCDIYYIIHLWKVTGWSSQEEVNIVREPTRDKEEADKQWSRIIKEEL